MAGDARKAIETQTGVPAITSKNAAQLSEFLRESLLRGELFTLEEDGQLYACTILNSDSNEG